MDPEVIVTNLHRRYTGVSGTINALLPVQSRMLRIGFVGTDLPGARLAESTHSENFVRLSLWQAIKLSRKKLADGRYRIWHVRRDPEMIIGVFLRDVLQFPIRLVFTSAAKHRHSWFPRWLISRMDAVIATTPEAAEWYFTVRAWTGLRHLKISDLHGSNPAYQENMASVPLAGFGQVRALISMLMR
jgi:mannosyltransferase